MRLLICTQTVDRNDPILGFFHRWIEELAKHCEQITVICLQVGDHSLPANVRVYSLGKEKKAASKLRYAWRFLRLIFRLRKQYDRTFVHMNQEYVLLGGWYWRAQGVLVYLWRNHPSGSMLTDIAALFCTKVFCTSKFSYTAKFKKTMLMPVGIDTELFKPNPGTVRKQNGVLFLGRIAPVKRPDLLLEALTLLQGKHISFEATIVGSPLPKDEAFYESLKRFAAANQLSVTFHPGVPNAETPGIYSAHQIFVNLSPSGMFDKTILEAMACECLVATSHTMLKEVVKEGFFEEGDAAALAASLERLLALEGSDGQKARAYGARLRAFVEEHHALNLLVEKLVTVLSSPETNVLR